MGVERGAEPDPYTATDQAEFRLLLKDLIRWAGYRSLRQLSEGAQKSGTYLPVSTISGALNNDKLPTESVLSSLATACRVDPRPWIDARGQLADQGYLLPAARQTDHVSDDCPYPGLTSFSQQDSAYFFGRESSTATLLGLLGERLDGSGPLIVGGPSGAGKSSLLHAGLLPALTEGRLPGSRHWKQLVCTPGCDPLRELTRLLAATDGHAATLARLRNDPGFAATALRETASGGPVAVIVVDQFEELFTLCSDEADRQLFVQVLHAVSSARPDRPAPAALVVLGVRADQYSRFAEHPELTGTLRHGQLLLGSMSRAELVTAIEQPAAAAGLELEAGLTDVLLADLGINDQRGYPTGALPLLAQALHNTWRQRDGQMLTVSGYRLTGGISGAIAHTANRTYDALDQGHQQIARVVLLRLVQLGEGIEPTRRQVEVGELVASTSEPAAAELVLDRLIRSRLVSVVTDCIVEIVHEALLRAWPTLREWIEQDREGLLQEQRFLEAAEQWERGGRHESDLYRGPRLASVAQRVSDETDRRAHLPPVASGFLRASLADELAQQQRAARSARRLSVLVLVLAALLLISVTATVVAVRSRADVVRQRDAGTSRELAAAALAVRTTDQALAGQLALVAHQRSPTAEARGAVMSALVYLDPVQRSNSDNIKAVLDTAFSADRRFLATAGEDESVLIWQLGAEPSLARPPRRLRDAQVRALEFSPDNRWLATASEDNTVRLWPQHTLEQNPSPLALRARANPLTFSPDGRLLVTGAPDRNTVQLWDLTGESPRVAGELPAQRRDVRRAAVARDGRLLATVDADGTARIWDITNVHAPVERHRVAPDAGAVRAVAFSPDGATMVTGHDDAAARLWDVAPSGGATMLGSPLRGHLGGVLDVTFSPGGRLLATAGDDSTVRLWNVSDRQAVTSWAAPLTSDAAQVYSVAFATDGHTLVSSSHNRTVRLWETDLARAKSMICARSAISRADWQRYLPDVDYAPPCPAPGPAVTPAVPSPGTTTLAAGHSRRCLASAGAEPGIPLHQGRCGTRGTSWLLRGTGSAVRIVDAESGLCLDATNRTATIGGAPLVLQQACAENGVAGQLWQVEVKGHDPGTADVLLVNLADPGRRGCLDVNGHSMTDDARIVVWQCGDPPTKQNQLFTVAAEALGR